MGSEGNAVQRSSILTLGVGFALVVLQGVGLAQGVPNVVDEPPGGLRAGPPVLSPPAQTSVNFKGKKIVIKYSAPSRRKRVIFGGLEPYGKVWRAGANDATLIHTDADLDLNGLAVPRGDYTLFVWLDQTQWQLIVNKQTGQTGLEYDARQDLGRVPMEMSKPPKTIERYRMELKRLGDNEGQLELAWENTVATVRFHLK
jgi:hypothetical protein